MSTQDGSDPAEVGVADMACQPLKKGHDRCRSGLDTDLGTMGLREDVSGVERIVADSACGSMYVAGRMSRRSPREGLLVKEGEGIASRRRGRDRHRAAIDPRLGPESASKVRQGRSRRSRSGQLQIRRARMKRRVGAPGGGRARRRERKRIERSVGM